MADGPRKRASPDNKRISLSEPYEVRYWSKKLGVTQTRLRSAVNSVPVTICCALYPARRCRVNSRSRADLFSPDVSLANYMAY